MGMRVNRGRGYCGMKWVSRTTRAWEDKKGSVCAYKDKRVGVEG